MMLAMLERRQATNPDEADLVSSVADRMTDETIASFMARAVATDRRRNRTSGAGTRCAGPARRPQEAVVDLAKARGASGRARRRAGFETMWENVANAVMSYTLVSNLTIVSDEYGKELSAADKQAIEVERVSDDPPERVQAWVTTVSESALAQLDLEMLLDLLRIEGTVAQWEPISVIAAAETERRTLAGDVAGAHALLEALVRETKTGWSSRAASFCNEGRGSPGSGPDRTARRAALPHGHRFGGRSVQPALSAARPERRPVAGRRARERGERRRHSPARSAVFSFGAAGRRSVEQLKNSPNPAVRRTAITLLRRAGGQEALLELASMLGDADPEVQRESIHAIVEIGTTNAYSVLHRLLLEADTPRDTALRELVSLRDDKAVPLFSYVLAKGEPRGKLIGIHISMIEALGTMKPRPESIRALQQVLLRGRWWAPFRTDDTAAGRGDFSAPARDAGGACRARSGCQQRRPQPCERLRERRSHCSRNGRRARHECSATLASGRRTLASPRGGHPRSAALRAWPSARHAQRASADRDADARPSIDAIGRHRHRGRRTRRRRSSGPSRCRNDGRVDASSPATRHRAHRHRQRCGGSRDPATRGRRRQR